MKIELNGIGDPQMAQLFIEGRAFNLEHHTKRLYPQNNPEGGVSLNGVTAMNGKYTLLYNRSANTLQLGEKPTNWFQTLVSLPAELLQGPITDNRRLNAINSESFKQRLNFVVASQTIFSRLNGALPVLDLVGDRYYVDMRLAELRSVKHFAIRIRFNEFSSAADGSYGWYDKKNKTVVSLDESTLIKTPANIYLVGFPNWWQIDPIGAARVSNAWDSAEAWNDARYINMVEMVVNPAASFKHISETHLASIIRENRAKRGLPPERIMAPKVVKIKHRRL